MQEHQLGNGSMEHRYCPTRDVKPFVRQASPNLLKLVELVGAKNVATEVDYSLGYVYKSLRGEPVIHRGYMEGVAARALRTGKLNRLPDIHFAPQTWVDPIIEPEVVRASSLSIQIPIPLFTTPLNCIFEDDNLKLETENITLLLDKTSQEALRSILN